jgi:c-di-GMP-binding flagellar brake protein YcgR
MLFGSGKDKAVNRRREPRYVLPTLTAYTEEGRERREQLVNVSRNGCCILTPVSLSRGEHVLVHFVASNTSYVLDDSFCIDSRVVWRKGEGEEGYRYGMEFAKAGGEFLEGETRAFREHMARLACQSYFDRNKDAP